MNLTTAFKLNIQATGVDQTDFNQSSGSADAVTDAVNLNLSQTLSNGTGANAANQSFRDQRSINTASNEELDLAGSLVDAFGDTITFTKIKGLYIRNRSTTNSLKVGGASANAFPLFDNSSDIYTIPPGGNGILLCWMPDANGKAVTAGTGDKLKLAHGSEDANALSYDILIIGTV